MTDTDPANGSSGDPPQEKSEKQLKKEAEKAAKLEKLKAKMDKKSATPAVQKDKPKKAVKEATESALYTAATAPGAMKDVTITMPSAYSPQYVEAAWYSWWEKEGFFKPEFGGRSLKNLKPEDKFVMMIPPPNVTGTLHLGHALTNAVEDAITRWHRMSGRATLWVPGCDHAGIATQVVVEKKLMREEGRSRHDLGREEFIKRVWDWKNEKGDYIYSQLRSLGSSFDWDRARFTMDPSMCRAVTAAFIKLHDEGDIYRANRLVNWSCSLKSAISDIEVDKVEVPGRTFVQIPGYENKVEFGVLVVFAYKVEGCDEEILVGTTRVETMLGDTAVAVHPEDARYEHLVGKKVIHPFCQRKIPIVADAYVDMTFGTGAVKITPAHDPNDYELGKRHNLPLITVLDDDGRVIGDCAEFVGMKRFDARRAVIKALDERKLYKETKENPMVVPFCSRSKDVVEPMLKPQWYIKCDKMASEAVDAVKSGALKIVPDVHVKLWNHWMENIRDWCISRQLWWGHRIPAYRVTLTEKAVVTDEEEIWVAAENEAEARAKAAAKFQVPAETIQLSQDEDVLDTWFSSGLFPFSVFGWPDNTDDLQAFYPGTLLETGHDILFFWVARMVFFGQRLMGKLPFREVYLHPMVRDAHGRKMSKSLGNVVDPLNVVRGVTLEELNKQLHQSNLDPRELQKALQGQSQDFPQGIPECGTDALRFALCAMTQGRDLSLDVLRVQGYRFFCNKLWNAVKFAMMSLPENTVYEPWTGALPSTLAPLDRWMLSRLSAAAEASNAGFKSYDFPGATTAIYNLWLYELCDVYLEYLKPLLESTQPEQNKSFARRTLFTVLEAGLRLLGPFMPYITEELYQRLPRKRDPKRPSICVARYPTAVASWKDDSLEADVATVMKMVHYIRSTRAEYNITNKQRTTAYLRVQEGGRLTDLFRDLQSLATSELAEGDPAEGCSIITVTDKIEIHLLLKGLIDPPKEIAKLEKKKTVLNQTVAKLNSAMSIPDYMEKIPAQIQQTYTERLAQAQGEIDKIDFAIGRLKLM